MSKNKKSGRNKRTTNQKPPVGTPPQSPPNNNGGGKNNTSGLRPAGTTGSKTGNAGVVVSLAVRPVDIAGYVVRHVEVQLDQRQRLALRALFNAMHQDHAVKLSNGRYVNNVTDCVRYLLEQVAEAIEEMSGKPIEQFVV